MYIKIGLLKTLKDLAREKHHQQLLSNAFLEAAKLNNGSCLSKDQGIKLIRFLYKQWRKLHDGLKPQNRCIYLAYEQQCWFLTREDITEVGLSIL